MVLPLLVVVFGLLLALVTQAAARVQCVDAARIGARGLARGEDPAAVIAAVRAAAPAGARVALHADGPVVLVAVAVAPPRGLLAAFDIPVRAEATAAVEPTLPPGVQTGATQ